LAPISGTDFPITDFPILNACDGRRVSMKVPAAFLEARREREKSANDATGSGRQ